MSAFVIGDSFLVRMTQEQRALRAKNDFFQGVEKIVVVNRVLPSAGRE